MGSSKTRSTARRKLRVKLRAQGLPDAEIERRVLAQYPPAGELDTPAGTRQPWVEPAHAKIAQHGVYAARRRYETAVANGAKGELLDRLRFTLDCELYGQDEAARRAYAAQPDQPDDTQHKPGWVDPVLRGQARAVGQAAAAVKRGTTIRRSDYNDRGTA